MPENPYLFPSIHTLVAQSVTDVLDKVKGMKLLILDSETTQILSLLFTHSYLLEKEILLTTTITDSTIFAQETDPDGSVQPSHLRHMKVIYLIKPTHENISLISNELREAHFKEYHIFFTNRVSEDFLERLAKSDIFELVSNVYEYFVDILALSDCLFSINAPITEIYSTPNISQTYNPPGSATHKTPNISGIYNAAGSETYNPAGSETRVDPDLSSAQLTAIVSSIYSICCLTNQVPSIVYKQGSLLCKGIATKLQAQLNNNSVNLQHIIQRYKKFESDGQGDACDGPSAGPSTGPSNGCLLLILDRRDDCVTPILNQWTYQAMIHELIGLNNNKVKVKDVEYVLNDEFYTKHLYSEFADVEADLNQLISDSKHTDSKHKIQDINKLLEMLPTQSKIQTQVAKHITILHHLSTIIQGRKLLNTGLIEQDIVSSPKPTDLLQDVVDVIGNKGIDEYERFRLAAIYSLYGGDVKDHLRMAKMDGYVERIGELEGWGAEQVQVEQGLFASLASLGRQDSTSPYLKHKSRLYYLLNNILKGRLSSKKYCILPNVYDIEYSFKLKPASIIVFMVGGATYAEARDCHTLATNTGTSILLGGTSIINSRQFISQVTKCNF